MNFINDPFRKDYYEFEYSSMKALDKLCKENNLLHINNVSS